MKETLQATILDQYDIKPSEKLGQHFLVDRDVIETLSNLVIPGAKVIEVGSGVGHVSVTLAERASEVIGIEIDEKFMPVLEEVEKKNPKTSFMFGNALQVDLQSLIKRGEEAQIISNLPFHITEPFLSKIVGLPIENAVLIVGDGIANEFQANEKDGTFGKISLLVQTFFHQRIIAKVPMTSFYPKPRTHAALVELIPKGLDEVQKNPANYVFAQLFRRAQKSELVGNTLKQAFVDADRLSMRGTFSKKEANKRERIRTKYLLRELVQDYSSNTNAFGGNESLKVKNIISQSSAVEVIRRMGLDDSILNKPFWALDNSEIRKLVVGVKRIYGD